MSSVLTFESCPPSTKKRAAVACTACHARKVRCNVVSSGRPCSNCQQDQSDCILHVSARGRHKRQRRERRDGGSRLDVTKPTPQTFGPSLVADAPSSDANLGQPSTLPPSTQFETPSDHPSIEVENFESNIAGYRHIVEHSVESRGAETYIYVGETQGLRYIFNAVKDSRIASCAHYMVPQANKASISPEDYIFLQAKGALNIESDMLRGELIALYFHHVHPLLPVIDPYSFFRQYELEGPSRTSTLLLQSMFLVASSYISPDGLRRSGAPSITALKKRYYLRAKLLYDFEYEADKTCLVQSLLLMGYWYGNTHDRTGSWHWIGIAISLSQAFGFHRDPGQSNIPLSHRRLWRRIWWCCVYRDRYIALGMGRPSRINAADCDVSELALDDLRTESSLSDLGEEAATTVQKCQDVSPLFLEMLKLAMIMGRILACQYRPVQSEPSLQEVQEIYSELQAWISNMDPICRLESISWVSGGQPREAGVHKHFVHITYHVLVILLYKPLVFRKGSTDGGLRSDNAAIEAWDKSVASASAATDILRSLAERELIGYLPPESVTTIIAVLSILFLHRLWSSDLQRQLASQNLDLAMLILKELEQKYFAARFIITYYTAAFQKIPYEAAQGTCRIVPPPSVASNGTESGMYRVQMTPDVHPWSLQQQPAENNPMIASTSSLSPSLVFPDSEFFWDYDLMGNIEHDLVGDMSEGI